MTLDLLIKNAHLVTGEQIFPADLGVKDGKIAMIGDLGRQNALETIDAAGLHLMPGGIDTQVHFREPGLTHKEDLESGTRAAVVGGVTTIFEMPNTDPTTTSDETLQEKLALAKNRCWANYGFFVGATTENYGELSRLEDLPGTPGVKIFMGSSTGPLLVGADDELRRVLENGKKRCPIHAEDEARNRERKSLISDNPHAREHPFLRDSESAILATNRIIALSKETGRPIHILHISTAEEPAIIQEAKKAGVDVSCEVTPQHLYFAGPDCYDRLGTFAQMNPPIRSERDRQGLWDALNAGWFDVFGSDHAPHTLAEKEKPYPQSPSGMPGVQTILPVLLTFAANGRLSLTTIVKMLCERPAEIYGIENKGKLQVGFDADLVLFDPEKSYVFERSMVQSKCGWSPYEGETLTGSIEKVWVGGRLTAQIGQPFGQPSGQPVTYR